MLNDLEHSLYEIEKIHRFLKDKHLNLGDHAAINRFYDLIQAIEPNDLFV